MNETTKLLIIVISILILVLTVLFGSLYHFVLEPARREAETMDKNRIRCYETENNNVCGKEKCDYDFNDDWRINYEQLLLERYKVCLIENIAINQN